MVPNPLRPAGPAAPAPPGQSESPRCHHLPLVATVTVPPATIATQEAGVGRMYYYVTGRGGILILHFLLAES
jgi:hypothetical protein